MIRFLGLLLLLTSHVYARDAHKYRVVVVGAGVSGFAAAATLLEHNVTDIIVLEAADRIGGRIHTVDFGGVVMDRGAEFCVGEKNNAVYELIGSHDLLVSYLNYMDTESYLVVNTTGHVFDSTLYRNLTDDAYGLMFGEDLSHFNGSVADYYYPRLDRFLQDRHVDPYLSEAVRHIMPLFEGSNSATENLEVLGAWGQSHYTECEGDPTLKWKNGTRGYKTIFDFLSKKLPDPSEELPVVNKTLLGKHMTRVERREGEAEVTCADGSTYLADHVIVTVSLGVLKKHAADMFHPPLPADKTASIETLGYGCLTKVFILFPTRWWPRDINLIAPVFSKQELEDYIKNSKHGSWTGYTYAFDPVVNNDRMLCVWYSGQTCRTVESLPEEQVMEGLMELLNKLVGKTYNIPRPEAMLRSEWWSNPLTLGAYSYRTVASDSRNLSNSDLAEPVRDVNNKPVLLFAGEATHSYHFGLVNGAIDTGRREAHNIINYMKKTA